MLVHNKILIFFGHKPMVLQARKQIKLKCKSYKISVLESFL